VKGIILWELLTLEEPWKAERIDTLAQLFHNVCSGNRPKIPKNCGRRLEELIKSCWASQRNLRPHFEEIVLLLDKVLLEYRIDDTAARNLWSEYFLDPELEETVSWEHLKKVLSVVSDIEQSKFDNLSPLLMDKEKNVTIESFNCFINWFGSDFFSSDQNSCQKYLSEIQTVIFKPWFHNLIETNEANSRLAHKPKGTFLIRLSTKFKEFPFTFSFVSDSQTNHIRIKKEEIDGRSYYSIIGHNGSYRSLIDLVEALIQQYQLVDPCGSPRAIKY